MDPGPLKQHGIPADDRGRSSRLTCGPGSGVPEYFPVQPGTRYRFGAYVKSRDILETNGGIEPIAEFVTRPETHLVTLSAGRTPGNPLVKGSFWLGDGRLTPRSRLECATP
jgi:hypothetical protein